MSDSNAIQLAVGAETTAGTAATGPYTLLNVSSVSLKSQKGTAESNTIRADRNLSGLIMTNMVPSGGFGFDFSYGNLDVLLPGMMCNTLSTPVSLTTVAGTVAGAVFTATTGTPFSVCTVGQWLSIVISGTRYIVKITAIGGSGASITVTGATLPSGAQTITTAKGKYYRNGVAQKTYTLEKVFTDQAASNKHIFGYLGCQANTMTLNAQAEQIVTGDMQFMGMACLTPYGTSLSGGAYTAAPTNQSFAGLTGNIGQFIVNGTLVTPTVMAVKGINASVTNNGRRDAGINVARMGWGQFGLTGTLSTYFQGGLAAVDAFFAHTPGSVSYVMTDPAGNVFVVTVNNLQFSDFVNQVGGKNQPVMGDLNFTAILDSTISNATLQFDMLDP
jgi:hypothetical protein